MAIEHEPMSLEEIKEQKSGWPHTQGIKIGDHVKLPAHDKMLEGRVIGVNEVWKGGRMAVYATIEYHSLPNVRPKIEVGELKAVQQDVKLMDHITEEIKSMTAASPQELRIVTDQIKHQLDAMNQNISDEKTSNYCDIFHLTVVLGDKQYHVILKKSVVGRYRLDVEKE